MSTRQRKTLISNRSEKIVEVIPLLAPSVFPVVALEPIFKDLFLRIFINHLLEIMRLKIVTRVLFSPLSERPLLFFQSLLLS